LKIALFVFPNPYSIPHLRRAEPRETGGGQVRAGPAVASSAASLRRALLSRSPSMDLTMNCRVQV